MMEPVRVLWTGGWDSTFRVCQLVVSEDRPVQPIYVLHASRKSTAFELEAMSRIRRLLDEQAPNLLAPTEVLDRDDFEVPPMVLDMYDANNIGLGKQYTWLAAAAEAKGWWGVELGLCQEQPGQISPLHLELVVDPTTPPSEFIRRTGSAVARLFERFEFPIMNLSKPEMSALAAGGGFADIMAETWFCHDPIRGRPCGGCRPCRMSPRSVRQMRYAPRWQYLVVRF